MLVIFLVYRPKKNTSFISYNPSFHVFFFIYPPPKKKKQHNNAGAPVFCFRKGRPKTNPSLWKVVKPVISQKAQGFGLRSWGSIEGVGGPRDHFGVEENCHFVRGNKGFEHDRGGETCAYIYIYVYTVYMYLLHAKMIWTPLYNMSWNVSLHFLWTNSRTIPNEKDMVILKGCWSFAEAVGYAQVISRFGDGFSFRSFLNTIPKFIPNWNKHPTPGVICVNSWCNHLFKKQTQNS